MTNDIRKEELMNRNIKLSPPVIALTWDVIFIWVISTLYFTQVKGFTNSQVILLDSVLMLSGCIMCVPIAKAFQNVSSIKAMRIGLLGYMSYLLLCIFGNSYLIIILAQPFLSFGYTILGVKSNRFLTDSLALANRGKDYQKVYGKGISLFYIIECVGAIVITYVYNWKPTMVFWCSICIVVFAIIITFFLKDTQKYMTSNISIDGKVEKPRVKKPDSFLKIMKSAFFVSLLVYSFFFRGVLSIVGSSFKIYLNTLIADGSLIMGAYGYIYAGSRIAVALSSKYQFKFNLKFGVRSLLIFNFLLLFTFVASGIIFIINPNSIISIILIVALCYIQIALRMPNQIFLNNYMQVCMPKRNMDMAYSIRTMVEYLGYALISFIYSMLLANFNDNFGITSLVYIAIFAVPLIISMIFFLMRLTKKHAEKYTIIKDEYTKD